MVIDAIGADVTLSGAIATAVDWPERLNAATAKRKRRNIPATGFFDYRKERKSQCATRVGGVIRDRGQTSLRRFKPVSRGDTSSAGATQRQERPRCNAKNLIYSTRTSRVAATKPTSAAARNGVFSVIAKPSASAAASAELTGLGLPKPTSNIMP